ncbi:MAG: MBL fold metallo-hydrolase [Desulfobacteraceae bacterium]|nr:MBL fold metallo-hydrolase [Desulfobacteraceae bacterium]
MSKKNNLDYERAVEIAPGIFWVGFYDKDSGLHCNPYLIVDNDEAVIIDGGSRPDFPTVVMKILQTGISVSSIKTLICQHSDPDVCGSIPDFEFIIEKDGLEILSREENNMFIRHYSVSSKMKSISGQNNTYTFSSGRTLKFIHTPYSHSNGSFVTFDSLSGVLFTSDLFGSYGQKWQLYLELDDHCRVCSCKHKCPSGVEICPMKDITRFHQKIMTSENALRYALDAIAGIPFNIIAPQHGSIISGIGNIATVFIHLYKQKNIGIDQFVKQGKKNTRTGMDLLLEREGENGNDPSA